jgi:hypothetical protein
LGLEFNDGFSGRFSPVFSLSNFKKSFIKRSAQYDKAFEVPVFNVVKIHGSVTWEVLPNGSITFSHDLALVKNIRNKKPKPELTLEIKPTSSIDELVIDSKRIKPDTSVDEFIVEYEKLLIINPSKEKFKQTLLNKNYYELLRIFSNELEKENSVLFVLGFSFSDEHIREVVLRSANSNPTLVIYVIAYDSNAKKDLEFNLKVENVKNKNIKIIAPDVTKPAVGQSPEDEFKYDLNNVTKKIFSFLNSTEGA